MRLSRHARFLDAFRSAPTAFADADGKQSKSCGNQIPAVLAHALKAGFDYSITAAFKVGGDALFVSSPIFRR